MFFCFGRKQNREQRLQEIERFKHDEFRFVYMIVEWCEGKTSDKFQMFFPTKRQVFHELQHKITGVMGAQYVVDEARLFFMRYEYPW